MELTLQLLSVLFVLGLIGFMAWLLRKKRGGLQFYSGERCLTGKMRLQLTPQHSIHLIQFRDREILLAAHPGGFLIIQDSK